MGVVAYLSLSGREVGWARRLLEAGRLLTFSTFRMGAYSRWVLIRGWALIRINTVHVFRQECKDLTTIFLKLKYMYPEKLIDSTFV